MPPPQEHSTHVGSTLEASETLWVKGIRRGDQAVFEVVFKTYYLRLCRFLLRMVGSREAAEDLAQEIFLKIWTNGYDWIPQGSLKAYLYRAAKNQAINYLKHRRVVRNWEEEAQVCITGTSHLEEELYQKELQKAIKDAIESLPDRCKLVFVLHRHDGLTYAEIAQALEISVKTVETQMGRALKALRRLLVPYLPLLASFSLLKDSLS